MSRLKRFSVRKNAELAAHSLSHARMLALRALAAARRCASLASTSAVLRRDLSGAGAACSGRLGTAATTAVAFRSAPSAAPPRLWAGLATSAVRQVRGRESAHAMPRSNCERASSHPRTPALSFFRPPTPARLHLPRPSTIFFFAHDDGRKIPGRREEASASYGASTPSAPRVFSLCLFDD